MKSVTAVHAKEFAEYTTFSGERDNYSVSVHEHPEFGRWDQRTMDLGNFKVTEHKTDLTQELQVQFNDDALTDQVNHCMCVDGSLGAHFGEYNLEANLMPGSYHYMTVQANEYSLAMSKKFHNVHVQISRSYYATLLCDSEEWSAGLKDNMYNNSVCYPGRFSLTPPMIRTISDIFSSPLSGSLKKLMIEAKVLELVALQLSSSLHRPSKKKSNPTRDILFGIHAYLQDSFLEDHSLKSICQKFGINEFALKNGFKESFQTTVFEFILSRRLEFARDLLQTSDYSIQEVGSKVGYKYPNHFSTAFKNKFGISPGKVTLV